MSEFQRYYATNIFSDKSGVCEVKTYVGAGHSAGTTAIISGVAGKRLRILSFAASSDNGITNYVDLRSSGGNFIFSRLFIKSMENILWPFDEAGWTETLTGEGLSIVVAGNYVYTTIRYIEVTP